jgi:thioredoxin reductase (NADPH)
MSEVLDCLIIGGGPAGLTAAIYLGRFRRRVTVVDGGESRAAWIAKSHNLPGFPGGMNGLALLERMREQARIYGAVIQDGHVDALVRESNGRFAATVDGATLDARTVILAAGVAEIGPPLPDLVDAVKEGVIRICPICDGYECIGKTVGVIGPAEHAAAEALFLRTYTDRLTVVAADEATHLSPDTARRLAEADIPVVALGPGALRAESDGVTVILATEGRTLHFDVAYSAFGTTPRTPLARRLGARLAPDARVEVDAHQQTSVEGLFAAGDLVKGLNQISVAYGEAAVAATAVHNRLEKTRAQPGSSDLTTLSNP